MRTRRMASSTDEVTARTSEIVQVAASNPTNTATVASSSRAADTVNEMIQNSSITTTKTKAGWCLREGLLHVITVDNGRMLDLVKSQGPPSFYHSLKIFRHEPTDNIKAPENCFQSLCRIIAGQQLAGKAAQAIWKRLLKTTKHTLKPSTILELAGENGNNLEQAIQKPAGLSKAKARSILNLAEHFDTNKLSENFLSDPESTEDDIREALLRVKGLGPWSCDMFIMFHLEKPNVFPFGDLGVRKGLAKVFQLKGKGPKGSLCQKKDLARASDLVEPYRPFQSLFTYYMWRAADVKDVYDPEDKKEHVASSDSPSIREKATETEATATSTTPAARKRKARVITP